MEPLFWVCKSLGGDLSSLISIGFWSKGPACLITGALPKKTEIPIPKEDLERNRLVVWLTCLKLQILKILLIMSRDFSLSVNLKPGILSSSQPAS